jgi:RPA family protein
MIIVCQRDDEKPTYLFGKLALQFYRAFCAEAKTTKPKVGDAVLGVKIIAITV